jgi:hypothetical protein
VSAPVRRRVRRPLAPAVHIDPLSAAAYGISGAMPIGAIVVLPSAVVLRVRADGGVDEVGGVPMRKSAASDPAAGRAP